MMKTKNKFNRNAKNIMMKTKKKSPKRKERGTMKIKKKLHNKEKKIIMTRRKKILKRLAKILTYKFRILTQGELGASIMHASHVKNCLAEQVSNQWRVKPRKNWMMSK